MHLLRIAGFQAQVRAVGEEKASGGKHQTENLVAIVAVEDSRFTRPFLQLQQPHDDRAVFGSEVGVVLGAEEDPRIRKVSFAERLPLHEFGETRDATEAVGLGK